MLFHSERQERQQENKKYYYCERVMLCLSMLMT